MLERVGPEKFFAEKCVGLTMAFITQTDHRETGQQVVLFACHRLISCSSMKRTWKQRIIEASLNSHAFGRRLLAGSSGVPPRIGSVPKK